MVYFSYKFSKLPNLRLRLMEDANIFMAGVGASGRPLRGYSAGFRFDQSGSRGRGSPRSVLLCSILKRNRDVGIVWELESEGFLHFQIRLPVVAVLKCFLRGQRLLHMGFLFLLLNHLKS